MKRTLFFTLLLLPLVAGCGSSNSSNNSNTAQNNIGPVFKAGENLKTRNYKSLRADDIHPQVDEGYVKISHVLIDSRTFVEEAEDVTYLYKLSCKDNTDSFQNHRFDYDADGCYYAEISEKQYDSISNGFGILWHKNSAKGSAVEISIDKIYKCFTYTELYYSKTEKKIKVVDFDHVIPGLVEDEVNSLVGKEVDSDVYVDKSGIKTMDYGTFPFSSELIINYIDVSGSNIEIDE